MFAKSTGEHHAPVERDSADCSAAALIRQDIIINSILDFVVLHFGALCAGAASALFAQALSRIAATAVKRKRNRLWLGTPQLHWFAEQERPVGFGNEQKKEHGK